MLKKITLGFILSLFFINLYAFHNNFDYVKIYRDNGAVQNAETALVIAEAIWKQAYGEKIIKEKPYHAKLINDSIWEVSGTLPKGYDGGVAYIRIRKKDCLVLSVGHSK